MCHSGPFFRSTVAALMSLFSYPQCKWDRWQMVTFVQKKPIYVRHWKHQCSVFISQRQKSATDVNEKVFLAVMHTSFNWFFLFSEPLIFFLFEVAEVEDGLAGWWFGFVIWKVAPCKNKSKTSVNKNRSRWGWIFFLKNHNFRLISARTWSWWWLYISAQNILSLQENCYKPHLNLKLFKT